MSNITISSDKNTALVSNHFAKLSNHSIFSTEEKKVLKSASIGKKIKNLTNREIVIFSGILLHKITFRIGQNKTEKEAEWLTTLEEDLKEHCAELTTQEVELLAIKATNGDFNTKDEVVYYSPANFVKWVRAYKDQRIAIFEKVDALKSAEIEEDDEEKTDKAFNNHKKNILSVFRRIKSGENFSDGKNFSENKQLLQSVYMLFGLTPFFDSDTKKKVMISYASAAIIWANRNPKVCTKEEIDIFENHLAKVSKGEASIFALDWAFTKKDNMVYLVCKQLTMAFLAAEYLKSVNEMDFLLNLQKLKKPT